MSIETSRKNSFQIIRLVSDMVMASDENTIKDVVKKALLEGINHFVFSVSIGSVSNQVTIFHLLLWCEETVRHQGGQVLFIEKDNGGKCIFRNMCESLNIPIYQNSETALVTIAAATSPLNNYKRS